MRPQTLALLVLAGLAAFLVVTVTTRMHQGRCRPGGARGGINCTFAPRTTVTTAAWSTGRTAPQ